jgi:hypothetical protein
VASSLLAPEAEPVEEKEEAESEVKEEAVLGIEVGWVPKALRWLRCSRRGKTVDHA